MKNRRILALSLAMTTALGALAFTGCQLENNDDGTMTVMNVSLNPEVEFILDKEDRVVSVNALNEEGNLIVSAEAFVGKSAEEAAKLFVEISKETGFLVSGNVSAGENEIYFSFSGDTEAATKLYNDVKSEVETYLNTENVTATLGNAAAITEAQLETLVAECAPYLEAAQVQAMDYAELLTALAESRVETAEFYSQELKNAYYEAKAFAMEQAELDTLKSHLNDVQKIAYDFAYTGYSSAVQTIENIRLTMLVNENSPYQVALETFRAAKTEYLNYRNYVAGLEQSEITDAISAQLAGLETAVEQAETALLNAGATANTALDTAKAQVKTAYDTVISFIEESNLAVNEYINEISENQKTAQETFFTQFETDYAAAVTAAQSGWAEMKTQLENGGATTE